MPPYNFGSPVAQQIGASLEAQRNCARMADASSDEKTKAHHMENERRWEGTRDALIRDCLPSGSGFDNGTQLVEEKSDGMRLVFTTAFHHMEDGGYTRWTEHTVTVRPTFAAGGLDIRVSGRDYRQIKDYIAETFHTALGMAPTRYENAA